MLVKIHEKKGVRKVSKNHTGFLFQGAHCFGTGKLESAYEACLMNELNKNGLNAQSQMLLPIIYDGKKIDAGYRLDILVENELIIEIKSVERTLPVHLAQVLSYLKLSKKKLGFLINFNVPRLMDGIKRVVNGI